MKHLHCSRSSRINLPKTVISGSVALILILLTGTSWGFAEVPDVGGKRGLDVMTVNLYVGAVFDPLTTLNPSDPEYPVKFLTGVATIYSQILTSNFPARAQAIAQHVARRGPDV